MSCALVVGGALSLAVPAVAAADSIVYLRDGNVWIADADGSGARQFTAAGNHWAWPSEADDGTVVVAGGASHSTYANAGSDLYRFKPDGTQIGNPVPTWGDDADPTCPTQPPYAVRVSPDGAKIAYSTLECTDQQPTSLWVPATSTTEPSTGDHGDEGYVEPAWVDDSDFVLSEATAPADPASEARFYVQATGDAEGSGTGWLDPTGDAREQAVISRTGTRLAVVGDDGPDQWNGLPTQVHVDLFSASSLASAKTSGWTTGCELTLSAADTAITSKISPTFSPDGSKLLWGDSKGVELASVSDLGADTQGHCTKVTPVRLISFSSAAYPEPFYAKGNMAAAPAPTPTPTPTATPAPTATPTPTPTVQPVVTPTPAPVRPSARFTVPKTIRARHAVRFDASASRAPGSRIVSYAWSFGDHRKAKGRRVRHAFRRPGTYKVTLTITDAQGRKVRRTVKVRVKK